MHISKERVEVLQKRIMDHVATHMKEPLIVGDRKKLVFEALNALGLCAGIILAGTEGNQQVVDFFTKSVQDTLTHLLENPDAFQPADKALFR
jgi:hypothetical protein